MTVEKREKLNILMVDDMPSKLLSYEAILAELDENLIKASTAREALEQLLKKEIAVVLMDVSMPEVDGFELAAMIHEHPRHLETAIIFVSGVHLSDLDRMKAYQRGAVDYVSVPIIPEILRAKVSVFVDLFRKRQQLEQINLELERRVSERTDELRKRNEDLQTLNQELRLREESIRKSQQNLEKALQAAEQASRLKDEFLATVSHELRTPLNTIIGWSHLLQSPNLEPGLISSGLSAIANSAKNQAQIVNDILDTEKIVNGKMELQPQSVSLTNLLSSALNTLAHAIQAKNIRVASHFEPGSEDLCLYVDLQRIQQVFWNVLSNAVKFSQNGGRIEIQVQRNPAEVVISFQDYGKGINPDFLPFVFDRFRQEDSSTTRKFGGLGLGLSIAKHLVELHGGNISVESQGEGKGSEFSIHLPSTLFIQSSTGQNKPDDGPAVATQKYPNLPKARVLVIDDDTNTLGLLGHAFAEAGAEIRTCQSGLLALGIMNTWQPDVLVSDIAMPDHDGYWLIREMKSARSSFKDIPAIALSAYASADHQTQAISTGFDAFVAKPVEPAEILSVADRLIQSQKHAALHPHEDGPNQGSGILIGKKILLLEDDLLFTEVLRIALQAQGSNFKSAAGASEAFAIVREWLPDAIISDLGLPDEDGFSFMDKLRTLSTEAHKSIPVLALSGYGSKDSDRVLAAGFSDFKMKPVAPESLVSYLVNLFKKTETS